MLAGCVTGCVTGSVTGSVTGCVTGSSHEIKSGRFKKKLKKIEQFTIN